MYEIEVINKKTGMQDTIIGYNLKDACRRKGWNPEDYIIILAVYID